MTVLFLEQIVQQRRLTFAGGVVSCRPGVGGLCGPGHAQPVQLVLGPLRPPAHPIIKRAAGGGHS